MLDCAKEWLESKGISSVLSGIVIALVLFSAFGAIVLLRHLQLGRVPEDIERQRLIQEKLRERLEGEVISVSEESATLSVRNIGDIAVSIGGIERRVGSRLETTPFEAELAPNEERELAISIGVFDGLGLLTSRGNLFPMEGAAGGIEILVLDSETLEPVPDASVTGTIHSDPIEVDVRTNDQGLAALRLPFYKYDEHTLDLVVAAPGYENRTVTGKFTLAENGHITVYIDYDPFDLSLSEYSGILTRYAGESWGSRQTTITATPRNAYETIDAPHHVGLATEADAILATVGSGELKFTSSASTTLMMRPSTSISSGTSTITVKAYDFNGRLVETVRYDLSLATQSRLSVPQPSPDFTISVSPSSRTINPGEKTSYTVTLTSVRGYWGEISLSVSGLPRNSTSGFSSNPVSLTSGGSVASTLNVNTSSSTPEGIYTLTVQGVGNTVKSASTSLTIEAVPAIPPQLPPTAALPTGFYTGGWDDRRSEFPLESTMGQWLMANVYGGPKAGIADMLKPVDIQPVFGETPIVTPKPPTTPTPTVSLSPEPAPPTADIASALIPLVKTIVNALIPFMLF